MFINSQCFSSLASACFKGISESRKWCFFCFSPYGAYNSTLAVCRCFMLRISLKYLLGCSKLGSKWGFKTVLSSNCKPCVFSTYTTLESPRPMSFQCSAIFSFYQGFRPLLMRKISILITYSYLIS